MTIELTGQEIARIRNKTKTEEIANLCAEAIDKLYGAMGSDLTETASTNIRTMVIQIAANNESCVNALKLLIEFPVEFNLVYALMPKYGKQSKLPSILHKDGGHNNLRRLLAYICGKKLAIDIDAVLIFNLVIVIYNTRQLGKNALPKNLEEYFNVQNQPEKIAIVKHILDSKRLAYTSEKRQDLAINDDSQQISIVENPPLIFRKLAIASNQKPSGDSRLLQAITEVQAAFATDSYEHGELVQKVKGLIDNINQIYNENSEVNTQDLNAVVDQLIATIEASNMFNSSSSGGILEEQIRKLYISVGKFELRNSTSTRTKRLSTTNIAGAVLESIEDVRQALSRMKFYESNELVKTVEDIITNIKEMDYHNSEVTPHDMKTAVTQLMHDINENCLDATSPYNNKVTTCMEKLASISMRLDGRIYVYDIAHGVIKRQRFEIVENLDDLTTKSKFCQLRYY